MRPGDKGRGGNPYINDAVQKIMERAQAIVVMLSPDDEAKSKDQFQSDAARWSRAMSVPSVCIQRKHS
jgi:hypothetical protein